MLSIKAFIRGRTLVPRAVAQARKWRAKRIQELEAKSPLALTRAERHELSRIGGRHHPAKIT